MAYELAAGKQLDTHRQKDTRTILQTLGAHKRGGLLKTPEARAQMLANIRQIRAHHAQC